jgi:hypothetical protein
MDGKSPLPGYNKLYQYTMRLLYIELICYSIHTTKMMITPAGFLNADSEQPNVASGRNIRMY